MLGQIATFIEVLHLSYADVLHNIPYRNLVIMQKDRMHKILNNEEVVEYKGARDNPKFKKIIS